MSDNAVQDVALLVDMPGPADCFQSVVARWDTANVRLGHREECLARGMDDFFGMPFKISELRTVLECRLPAH